MPNILVSPETGQKLVLVDSELLLSLLYDKIAYMISKGNDAGLYIEMRENVITITKS